MTTVRVGVTGHRALAEPVAAAARVDEVLDRLTTDGADLVCVSSLAEGADRLVAERVLARPAGRLVVVLPREPLDYADDFQTDGSRQRFDELCAAADEVTVLPPDPADQSREAAYARAGSAVVRGCDALIALWDGQGSRGRGGTAEVVAEAEQLGVDVHVVPVERGAV